jgi:FkbM family methyltransferase
MPRAPFPWSRIVELGVHDRARPILIDIGAHVGGTTISALRAGSVQHVYAAEPDPQNYAALLANVSANGLAARVTAECCAIADTDGEGRLHRGPRSTAHALVPPGRAMKADKVTTVPTRRLSTWITTHDILPSAIQFVKLDAQGWEGRILEGADRLLADGGIVWIIEVSPKHLEAAGTPLPILLDQLAGWFTHAIDIRRGQVLASRQLPEALAGVKPHTANTYVDLLLYGRRG